MSPIKDILIISNPEDEHTKRVTQELEQLDVTPILFYPEKCGDTANIGIGLFRNYKDTGFVHIDGIDFDPKEIKSVWYRRPRPALLRAYALDTESLQFARDEWQAGINGVYDLLKSAFWISHPDNIRTAERKVRQLQVAREFGLTIPDTLISNDTLSIKRFIDLHNGEVIVKATGTGWVVTEDKKDIIYVLTNRLTENDYHNLDDIAISPITMQEEIRKSYELRVNIVGQEILAIKIDSQRSDTSKVDWRRYDITNTPYSAYTLPLDISQACLKLAKAFKLEFGAIDLIRDTNGRYVFLEINPNGQFLWAEDLSGVPVSRALASLLARRSAPLASAKL